MNKLYLSNRDIEKGVHDIVNSMYADNWRPDYIVGITRGGLIPAVMMSHLTGIKMHTLDVRLRDGDEQQSNYWMAEDAFGIFQMGGTYEDKKILILDDINDTGATFQWIKEDWPAGCHPNERRWDKVWHNNVRFATIVNNLSSKFEIDHASIEINKAEEDTWVVFPYEEWW
jgi:hypoxanthine phosphoribosyltransferase